MYGTIRCIIGVVFVAIVMSIFRSRKKMMRRKDVIILVAAFVVLTTVLSLLPFENLFVTFDSPEAVYKYYNFGEGDVKLVVEGKNSDLVIGSKGDTDVLLGVPKVDGGWKIGSVLDFRMFMGDYADDISVTFYKYNNDYFISVSETDSKNCEIIDSCGSEFILCEGGECYASIVDYTPEYWIEIDGYRFTSEVVN